MDGVLRRCDECCVAIERMNATTAAERISSDCESPLWSEHLSRYLFAAQYIAGKRILDIACGRGYGTALLAEAGATQVVGVDISAQAVAEAKRVAGPRVAIQQADGIHLPFRNASIDVVVSLETIEHIQQANLFVGELRRVVASDGLLIISTPNALYTKPIAGMPHNPYHVREFTPEQLVTVLGHDFSSVALLGQRVHPRYRPCPYWERPEQIEPGIRSRLRVAVWKAERRLPLSIRQRAVQRLHHRALYPGENDFVFSSDEVDRGHVIVAMARP
jgi:2-polyprenyl-3-methyl-5-hydroxy-6-metoxy-1,4-benzoquinol methylase